MRKEFDHTLESKQNQIVYGEGGRGMRGVRGRVRGRVRGVRGGGWGEGLNLSLLSPVHIIKASNRRWWLQRHISCKYICDTMASITSSWLRSDTPSSMMQTTSGHLSPSVWHGWKLWPTIPMSLGSCHVQFKRTSVDLEVDGGLRN